MGRRPVHRDPDDVLVQINTMVPYWRRVELYKLTDELGITMTDLVLDAIDRVHPPSRQYAGKR